MATERLGILGGTFDPPHVAHVHLAEAARDQFDLDRVLLVVAGDPWQKAGAVEAGAEERLAMAEAAFSGMAGIEVSAMEVGRPGPTYTVDTLEALARDDRVLLLILGADAAARIQTWHRAERVRELATLLVADRSGSGEAAEQVVARLRERGWRCEVLNFQPHAVSSTALRQRLAGGEDVAEEIPVEVVRVVEERGLYTRSQ
ncbi:MAG TPA: nicotinate-nucleotide adenylyltransferase [Acidimicrobiia bacterium]|nr:nicotinate-nucleotide adenylyltransferase [Acidimicrobiia bacterium]